MPKKPVTPAARARWKRNCFKRRKGWNEEYEMQFINSLIRHHAVEGYITAMQVGEHRYWIPEQVRRLCEYAKSRSLDIDA